jgi:hypothetical protein
MRMTAHQTATLIIRLLGPVWFLYLLNQIGAIAALLDMGSVTRPGAVFVVCMLVVQFLCAALLWLRPATIAAKLLPSTLSNRPQPPTSPLQWQTLGVVCIGLWQLADTVPHLIYLLTLWRAATHSGVANAFDEARQASLLAAFIRIGIGLWLALGAKGFSAMLFKVRTAGLKIESQE